MIGHLQGTTLEILAYVLNPTSSLGPGIVGHHSYRQFIQGGAQGSAGWPSLWTILLTIIGLNIPALIDFSLFLSGGFDNMKFMDKIYFSLMASIYMRIILRTMRKAQSYS